MKRLFALSCLILTCFAAPLAHAETEVVDGIAWTYRISNGKATITDIPDSTAGSVTIPSTLGGAPVSAIGDSAFEDCTHLSSVTIPHGVTTIEIDAFFRCTNLTSIIIPSSVSHIENAFAYCSSLTSITLPEGITSIYAHTFLGCRSLISITIPSNVTSIEGFAFYDCTSLTSIAIPDSVTVIGTNAFWGCENLPIDEHGIRYESANKKVLIRAPETLSGDFLVPDSVRILYGSSLSGCSNLTSVTIPDSVTAIGENVFRGCGGLFIDKDGICYESEKRKVLVEVPKEFSGDLQIPESVRFIQPLAFSECGNLTSITIPEGVTTFEDDSYNAFSGCNSLTSITIPNSMSFITEGTFGGCAQVKIEVGKDNPVYASSNGSLFNKEMTTLLFASGVNESYTIPKCITAIGVCAFKKCSDLT